MASNYADTVENGIISDNAIVGEGFQDQPMAGAAPPPATRTPGIPRSRGGVLHALQEPNDADTPDIRRTDRFTSPTSGRAQHRPTDDDQRIVNITAPCPGRSTRHSHPLTAAVTPAPAGVGLATTNNSCPVPADIEFVTTPTSRQAPVNNSRSRQPQSSRPATATTDDQSTGAPMVTPGVIGVDTTTPTTHHETEWTEVIPRRRG
jgi:hypothetical protein